MVIYSSFVSKYHIHTNLQVDAVDRLGRTPLGLAMWAGYTNVVNTLLQEKVSLSEEGE